MPINTAQVRVPNYLLGIAMRGVKEGGQEGQEPGPSTGLKGTKT